MRLVIFFLAAALPVTVMAQPVYLSCSFEGAESARVTLNEASSKATVEQGSTVRTVDAVYTPDAVKVLKMRSAYGGQTIEINRIDLTSKFVVTIAGKAVAMNGACKLQEAPKRAF